MHFNLIFFVFAICSGQKNAYTYKKDLHISDFFRTFAPEN